MQRRIIAQSALNCANARVSQSSGDDLISIRRDADHSYFSGAPQPVQTMYGFALHHCLKVWTVQKQNINPFAPKSLKAPINRFHDISGFEIPWKRSFSLVAQP